MCTVAKKENNSNISSGYLLKQNYPNPFNSITIIQFTIPPVETHRNASLQLNVYDITGKEIATLVDNINTSSSYEVKWNASGYPSGIYFYQLQYNSDIIATRKILLMK